MFLYPAFLFPALIGGWRSGVAAAAVGLLVRATVLRLPVDPLFGSGPPGPASLATFAVAAGSVVATGVYVRFLIGRLRQKTDELAQRDLHYRTLFEATPEGFAICDAIFGENGHLADYTVVEINPALRSLLGVGPDVVGKRLSRWPRDWTDWLERCDQAMTSGETVSFEVNSAGGRRWHEVRLTPISRTRLAQFFFDITERKSNEARQAALYDELNHRVKNNLAVVASLLQLQARRSGDEVRDQLDKAAGRVRSIADVHAALTRNAGVNRVEFDAYLRDLCDNLRQSLAMGDRFEFQVRSEPLDLPAATAVPLGMAVNELVTNAVKYAYPDGGGPIDVEFFRIDGTLCLRVRDSGPGLPADANGLGMRLVRSLAEQAGGDVRFGAGVGAIVEITLPDAPIDARAQPRRPL